MGGDAADDLDVMRDKDVGRPAAPLQVPEQRENVIGDERVQRRGDLVADDDIRLRSERTGDTDALLLSAGELGGTAAGELAR